MPRGKRKAVSVEEELQLVDESLQKAEDAVKELKKKRRNCSRKRKSRKWMPSWHCCRKKGCL